MLMIVLTLALLVLTYLIGLIRFHNYSLTMLETAKIENSVYLKLAFDETQVSEDFYHTFASFAQKYEQIKSWSGVRDVLALKSYGSLTIEQNNYQVIIYDDAWLRHFSIPVNGNWFSTTSLLQEEPIPVVLGGTDLSDYKVDALIAGKTSNTQESVTIQVSGKVKFPGLTPSLSNSSTKILSDHLFDDRPVILMYDDPYLIDLWNASERQLISENAWIIFEDNLSEEQKKALYDQLRGFGSFNTYNDITIDSRAAHLTQLKRILPIPLFLFFCALTSLFSISALYVIRNSQNMTLYFFCGCSRLRLLIILGKGLSLIFTPPTLFTLAFIYSYPKIKEMNWLNFNQIVLDRTAILAVILFLAILLIILLIQPLIINHKRSPLQLYRRIHS